MKSRIALLATITLTFICVLLAAGCSSSKSAKPAAPACPSCSDTR